jgi:hypothetical protein
MQHHYGSGTGTWRVALVALGLLASVCPGAEHPLFVSPAGDDAAAGTQAAPFRTVQRAQEAVRLLAKNMDGDVVVNLAPGDYRLDRTLAFTEADSGRNGFHVIYRSAAGPGQARLLGSKVLTGWQPYRDGIWKIDLPPKTLFHTLYENGQRVHKARFPDLEVNPDMPTALGRYLVTVDGSPKMSDKILERPKGPGWLAFRPEDVPPLTTVTKMRIHIFAGGTCDWVREIQPVISIDPQSNRLTLAKTPSFGIGKGARFFLEDELGFLNVPGEFFVDEQAHTLYYMPLGKAHPDTLGIAYPVISRMIQLQGPSREQCLAHFVLDGLALEETDNAPPAALWAYDGRRDGALLWMSNTAHVEIRNCHLKNSGRSGVMVIGHNTDNLITGCWLEHLGLNGVSFCNKFLAPDKKSPTADRCESNRVHNTRISHVGELHTYAECVTVFNVSHNEVDHCQLDNSVRYAITLRGNTGEQYGPPVSTAYPPTAGNWFHHIRVERCGQDGGDMGALHAAGLNNPGGGCTNTFEQITITDTRAIPSMKDIAPNGIFLDWPKMAMDQVFRHVQIVRTQGAQFRSHKPENGESARTENVSWQPGFREDLMDYAHIGLTADFPAAYGGQPANAAVAEAVPPGAAALGYTRCLINEVPAVSDIAPGRNGNYKWFSGQWFSKTNPSPNHYMTRDHVLALKLGGNLVSAPLDFSQGQLPLLSGAAGFYVEFDVWLSDNDRDHWPAVWLMPAEHDGKHDHYEGDPQGFERFMELDVDEGGFGPGLAGTVHSTEGVYPKWKHIQNPNNVSQVPLDRSQKHTFGASYDPVQQKVTWWLDGKEQMSAGAPYVPAVAARQHFYLLLSGQSHGAKKPHYTFVSAVRAFVPPAAK